MPASFPTRAVHDAAAGWEARLVTGCLYLLAKDDLI